MKKIFLIGVLGLMGLVTMAQDEDKPMSKKEKKRQRINELVRQEEEGTIKFSKHFFGGIKIANDGYGGFLEKGISKTPSRVSLFQFEIGERKHPKEDKSANYFGIPITFGKINFFYPVKLGLQQQFLLGNKGNKNGVHVSFNVGGGLSLGVLRKYEVEIQDNITGQMTSIYYGAPNDSLMLEIDKMDNISGPTIFKGWSKVTMSPGVYGKAALRFDYGPYNDLVTGLEIGVNTDYYFKKVPQMIFQKQNQFFPAAYISLIFGKRK